MFLYRNITDEVIEDKITGERFQPGHDYWVRDEVQPDYLLRECKTPEDVEKVELVKTDYLLDDPRFVVVKEMVYKEPEKPSEFITDKDGKLTPNPTYDAKAHYHGTSVAEERMTEGEVGMAKEAYLASLNPVSE